MAYKIVKFQAIAESPEVEYRDGFVRKRENWNEYLASEAKFAENSPDGSQKPSESPPY